MRSGCLDRRIADEERVLTTVDDVMMGIWCSSLCSDASSCAATISCQLGGGLRSSSIPWAKLQLVMYGHVPARNLQQSLVLKNIFPIARDLLVLPESPAALDGPPPPLGFLPGGGCSLPALDCGCEEFLSPPYPPPPSPGSPFHWL